MAEIIAQRTFTVRRAPKDGKPGEPGNKGEDALTLVVTPNTFVFQTNNKGVIENLAQNKGKIRIFLGQTEVVPSSIEITPYNCYARIVGDNTLHFDGISPNQWSGKVEITATYKGQTRTAIAEFMVSAQKWNEAKFEANQQQFQSIIAQNKADKQGLEQKISTIKQDAENIRLEVSKQTFSGVNLLKGASLRLPNLLSIDRPYVTIVSYPSVAHFDNPYLSISRHGATQDEWNGCKFPILTIQGGKTYTLSMFTRIYGSEQPYIEVKRSRSKDMSAPKNSYPNIPSTYGVWKQYTYTFEMEDGYNYLQIFIYLTRNGEAYISEIQLEEGTKATTWKDPDVMDSIERTGIDLTNGTVSVEAANFEIKHNGEKPFVVSKGKALLGGWVFDKGKLFSQCGDLNGSPSTDYGNANFDPDIVLDPVNGYMSGVGSFRKKMLVITPQNIAKYAIINSDGDYAFMAGKISAIALFKGSFNRTIYITLPGVAGDADFEIARTLIGETIAIYNQTTSYMMIWGSGQSTVLYPNKFAALEVKISVNPQTGKESYYNIDWIKGEMLV
uniref:S-layer associated multidomain endoglucanase 16 carbohydrate binding module-2.9A n=1 Tax=Siphoviridae sp. ctYtb10 TaxID=2825553 RepID=A0A8S5PBA9_9CAUD|nr:MAG TPA: S-layer associated multidomain endoglucanase 16 carbohydrate binding module-2.9A [Siphoviridae sp. ctYtb10]